MYKTQQNKEESGITICTQKSLRISDKKMKKSGIPTMDVSVGRLAERCYEYAFESESSVLRLSYGVLPLVALPCWGFCFDDDSEDLVLTDLSSQSGFSRESSRQQSGTF